MTSYEPPDYYIKVKLNSEEFEGLSGNAFTASVSMDNQSKAKKGMIIVPQIGNEPDESGMCDAWLWLDKAIDLAPGTEIRLKINSPCDPMLTDQEESELKRYRGLILPAVITQNNNAEMESR